MKRILVCRGCERDLSRFVELNLDAVSEISPTAIDGEEGYVVQEGTAIHHLKPIGPKSLDPAIWMNTRDVLHDRVIFDEAFMAGYGYDYGPNTVCNCSNMVGSMYTNRFLFEFFYFEPDLSNTYWSEVGELDQTRIERLYKQNRRSKQNHG